MQYHSSNTTLCVCKPATYFFAVYSHHQPYVLVCTQVKLCLGCNFASFLSSLYMYMFTIILSSFP